MSRRILLALCLSLPLASQAASLKAHELAQQLSEVARQSSVGTPRAINEDILDEGYTSEGAVLTNHLSVRPQHAAQMRANPDQMRQQLGASVCHNSGYRQLLAAGAQLRYEFREYQTKRPITTERFTAADCGL